MSETIDQIISIKSPRTLSSLPDELLQLIFDHTKTDNRISLISKRFLPFYFAALRKKVDQIGLTKWRDYSKRYLTLTKQLSVVPSFAISIRSFTADLHRRSGWSPGPFSPLSPEDFVSLTTSMVNLEHLDLCGPLEHITLSCSAALHRPYKFRYLLFDARDNDERYQEEFQEEPLDCFDLSVLNVLVEVSQEWDSKWWSSKSFALRIEREDSEERRERIGGTARSTASTFSVHSFSRDPLDEYLLLALKGYPVLDLTICNVGEEATDFSTPLALVQSASDLISLALYTSNTENDVETLLPAFPNLTYLALAGAAFPETSTFYDLLRSFPLQSLHLGLETYVVVDDIRSLIAGDSKRRIPTLKEITLDNIEFAFAKPDWAGYFKLSELIRPQWTEDCSEEDVRRLKRVARDAGISTHGRTFEALSYDDNSSYRAVMREIEVENEIRWEKEVEEWKLDHWVEKCECECHKFDDPENHECSSEWCESTIEKDLPSKAEGGAI